MRKLLLGAIAAAAFSGTATLRGEEEDLFTKLDTNKDGFVTLDEVEGERKPLFERMLRNADKDADKKLSKDEFQAGLKGTEEPRQPLAGGPGPGGRPGGGQFSPKEIFARMDANKDGKLSKDEAPDRMRENFDRIDANSDGNITEEELTKAMSAFAGGQPGVPGRGPQNPQQAEEIFNRTDANSDGKLTKDEIPEDRREGFSRMLERLGADSVNKEQFVRFLMAQVQGGQPGEPRPGEGQPRPGGFGPPPVIAALDADGDGELSGGEIEAAAKALLKLDKNSDGKLTREELAPQFSGFRPGQPGQPGQPGPGQPGGGRFIAEMIDRLKAADANKDGKLSKEEAPEQFKERFDRVDANSDGFVDETELKQMADRLREGFGGNRPAGDGPPRRPGNGDAPPRRPDAEKP